jgi:hypothetical protein
MLNVICLSLTKPPLYLLMTHAASLFLAQAAPHLVPPSLNTTSGILIWSYTQWATSIMPSCLGSSPPFPSFWLNKQRTANSNLQSSLWPQITKSSAPPSPACIHVRGPRSPNPETQGTGTLVHNSEPVVTWEWVWRCAYSWELRQIC